jgi:uncharacterized protein YijF (DUF1287 family)
MLIDRRSFTGMALTLFAAQRCAAIPPETETIIASGRAAKLITAARKQIGVTVQYDPAYSALSFPGGDVSRSKGVCTDVVIRAYRDALGIDLQAMVNADMKANFAAYPRTWGLKRADRNIDHRRVPNLQIFLNRNGAALDLQGSNAAWKPGDIFTSLIGGRLPHIGIVSDRSIGNRPLVIHNIGAGAREEDALFLHTLTGHYRWQLA